MAGAEERGKSREGVSGFRFRAYHPGDRDGCMAVFDSNVPGAFRVDERREFGRYLDSPPGPILVLAGGDGVAGDGEVVGCGGVAREEDGRISLCWGMVRADLHGRGLGKALLEARVRLLEQEGAAGVLRLETIPETEGFFTHLGFRVVRREADGYGPGLPLVELERRLCPPKP